MKHKDTRNKVSATYGFLSEETSKSGKTKTLKGVIDTPNGKVSAFSVWYKSPPHIFQTQTQLYFIWKGYEYHRQIEKYYTPIGLARKAAQLVKDIVESNK